MTYGNALLYQDLMHLKEYLKKVRLESGQEKGAYAQSLNISESQVTRYENGSSTPSEIVVHLLEKLYDVDAVFLRNAIANVRKKNIDRKYGGHSSASENDNKDDHHIGESIARYGRPAHEKKVPVFSASCGFFKETSDLDYPAGHADEFMPTDSKDHNAYYVKAKGDSMTGFRIEDGDFLLVEPNRQINNGDIVLFIDPDNGCTVKKFLKVNGKIYLKPGNSDYPDMVIENGDNRIRAFRISSIMRKI